jgi:signal transduction histidine kinase/ligand-binding sensor domain-containing protein
MGLIERRRARGSGGLPASLAACGVAILLWSCDTVDPVGFAAASTERTESVLADPHSTHTPLPIRANPQFVHINVEQGLSQSTVFDALQDKEGYMWFGTEDGLNRYDGYDFAVYRHDPDEPNSLSHHWINAIVEDHTGVLWVATDGGGLNRYEREKDQFVRYQADAQDPDSLSNNEVTAILEDSSGTLWFGTRDGLSRYDREQDAFVSYRHEGAGQGAGQGAGSSAAHRAESEILALFEDSKGVLWVGTDGAGLSRFDRETETFTNFPIDATGTNATRSAVRAIYESQGRLWIGTQGGLIAFDPNSEQFGSLDGVVDPSGPLSTATVYSIYEDRDGILWVGTWGDGIFVIHPQQGVLYNYRQTPGKDGGLSNNMAISSFQDREGSLWIGTAAAGLSKLTADNRAFAYYEHDPNDANSLSDNWVRSIFEDKSGMLWISTGDGGLNRYDRETETWRNFVHDPADPRSVGADFLSQVSAGRDGTLWIATENGVDRFDESTETFTHFRGETADPTDHVDTNRIRHVYEDTSGRLWIAIAGYGIAELNAQTGVFTRFRHEPDNPNSLIHDKAWHIYEDGSGNLWISTSGGLGRLDPRTETFTQFWADADDPLSLSSHYVGTVVEDSSGTLWIGSYGGGLHRFDRETETFVYWMESDGLANNVAYAIAVDDRGYLWISTNNGLSRFDPGTESFANFQLKDGLPIVEFNANSMAKSRTGELFFGGINGFVSFHPDSVQKNQYVPAVVFTDFARGDQRIQISGDTAEITIKWPLESFEFEYAALSYSNPELNQYAYMLEGLDDHWIQAGTSRAGRYDRLPGGSYTLRVIGSNDDGLWNESGATLSITVVPPFWETWWLRGIVVMVVLSVMAGLYALRVRSIKARNRKLEREVEERAAALRKEAIQRLAAEESLHRVQMERAVADERSRLARDLHDSVTQSLYSLTLFTEATRELAEAGKLDQVKHGLVRCADTALQALKEMRLLVYELRPLALRETGLIGAIRHRLDAVETRAGVKTRLVIDGDPETQLSQNVEEVAFRIAQEALNNALKHAHAATIAVRMNYSPEGGGFELEVSDDGKGFDHSTLNEHGGLGLKSIQERAEGIGAQTSIDSTPGEGTCVRLITESP